ncbi:MAG: hypothetical protein LBQ49_01995 [Rickettsiales bacterium]|jgi:hypothetical protein|nr:hypothetical protein [Rickettsiales bacterium]
MSRNPPSYADLTDLTDENGNFIPALLKPPYNARNFNGIDPLTGKVFDDGEKIPHIVKAAREKDKWGNAEQLTHTVWKWFFLHYYMTPGQKYRLYHDLKKGLRRHANIVWTKDFQTGEYVEAVQWPDDGRSSLQRGWDKYLLENLEYVAELGPDRKRRWRIKRDDDGVPILTKYKSIPDFAEISSRGVAEDAMIKTIYRNFMRGLRSMKDSMYWLRQIKTNIPMYLNPFIGNYLADWLDDAGKLAELKPFTIFKPNPQARGPFKEFLAFIQNDENPIVQRIKSDILGVKDSKHLSFAQLKSLLNVGLNVNEKALSDHDLITTVRHILTSLNGQLLQMFGGTKVEGMEKFEGTGAFVKLQSYLDEENEEIDQDHFDRFKQRGVFQSLFKVIFEQEELRKQFGNFDGGSWIVAQYDKAKEHTKAIDDLAARHPDEFSLIGRIRKNIREDVFERGLSKLWDRHYRHKYIFMGARGFATAVREVGIKPEDGLWAILDKKDALLAKVKGTQAGGLDAYNILTKLLEKSKADGDMKETITGAAKHPHQMRALVQRIIVECCFRNKHNFDEMWPTLEFLHTFQFGIFNSDRVAPWLENKADFFNGIKWAQKGPGKWFAMGVNFAANLTADFLGAMIHLGVHGFNRVYGNGWRGLGGTFHGKELEQFGILGKQLKEWQKEYKETGYWDIHTDIMENAVNAFKKAKAEGGNDRKTIAKMDGLLAKARAEANAERNKLNDHKERLKNTLEGTFPGGRDKEMAKIIKELEEDLDPARQNEDMHTNREWYNTVEDLLKKKPIPNSKTILYWLNKTKNLNNNFETLDRTAKNEFNLVAKVQEDVWKLQNDASLKDQLEEQEKILATLKKRTRFLTAQNNLNRKIVSEKSFRDDMIKNGYAENEMVGGEASKERSRYETALMAMAVWDYWQAGKAQDWKWYKNHDKVQSKWQNEMFEASMNDEANELDMFYGAGGYAEMWGNNYTESTTSSTNPNILPFRNIIMNQSQL